MAFANNHSANNDRDWCSMGPTNPRWEPVARLAVRLGSQPAPADPADAEVEMAQCAARLLAAAEGNDVIVREALAVFISGADRGQIGSRAADSLRMAIRLQAHNAERKGLKRLIHR